MGADNNKIETLTKAIDIAIDAFQKYPPRDFQPRHIAHMVQVYSGFKTEAQSLAAKRGIATHLKYLQESVFIFFQEGSGNAVDYFWQQVADQNLGYKRENRVLKILKRGRLKNRIEYEFVTDVLVAYRQQALIDAEQSDLLQQMLRDFEEKGRKP